MILRGRNPTASRDRVATSTEDDERVEVDAPRPGETKLDPVAAGRAERLHVDEHPADVRRSIQADRRPVEAVDVDRRAPAARTLRGDDRDRTSREGVARARAGGRGPAGCAARGTRVRVARPRTTPGHGSRRVLDD